jgi:hypothetical protein
VESTTPYHASIKIKAVPITRKIKMTTTVLSARDIMRAAYENRYTWNSDFPGYTAEVTFKQGDAVHTAKVRVNPDLKFDVTDVADEAAQKAINGQVWEIAVHRVSRPFEQTHAQNEFDLGATDETGAVEILVKGKATGDKYKVRDRKVTLVHRHIHGTVVTINTFSTTDTPEGYLSHTYDSVYSDPQTGEVKGSKSFFEDSYEKIGRYYILSKRVITTEGGAEPAMEFTFSNLQLL